MSVTLIPPDLKQPTGELEETLFPSGNLDDLIVGWLAQAKTKVEANTGIDSADHNNAAAAWVYHRGYSYLAQHFAGTPSTASVGGKVSRSFEADQRMYFAKQATAWLGAYAAFDIVTPVLTTPATSMRVQNQAVW